MKSAGAPQQRWARRVPNVFDKTLRARSMTDDSAARHAQRAGRLLAVLAICCTVAVAMLAALSAEPLFLHGGSGASPKADAAPSLGPAGFADVVQSVTPAV